MRKVHASPCVRLQASLKPCLYKVSRGGLYCSNSENYSTAPGSVSGSPPSLRLRIFPQGCCSGRSCRLVRHLDVRAQGLSLELRAGVSTVNLPHFLTPAEPYCCSVHCLL